MLCLDACIYGFDRAAAYSEGCGTKGCLGLVGFFVFRVDRGYVADMCGDVRIGLKYGGGMLMML